MRVYVCVCACAPHFAKVSKIVQDAARAGAREHKHQSDHHTRNTSDHHESSRAGAQPQARERDQSERTSAGTRARAYKKKLQKQ